MPQVCELKKKLWCALFFWVCFGFFFKLWSQIPSVGGGWWKLLIPVVWNHISQNKYCCEMLRISDRVKDSTIVPYRGLQSSTDGNSTSLVSVPFLLISVCFFSVTCCFPGRDVEAGLCHLKFHLQAFFWLLCRCWGQGRAGCSLLHGGSLKNWRAMGIFKMCIFIRLLAGRSQY